MRWRPEILDFATALYLHGGRSAYALASGGMFAGCGKQLTIDLARSNLWLPSLSTVQANIRHFLPVSGLTRAPVLMVIDLLTAYDLPLVVTLHGDSTTVIQGLEYDSRNNEVVGAVTPIPVADVLSDAVDVGHLSLATSVLAFAVRTLPRQPRAP